jgi:Flp pilus assembly protein TadG
MRRLLSAAAGSVTLAGHRRGVIAIMFALLMVPLIIVVALSVDFSFYIVSQAQLNLAADAAAMHAVRVASQYYVDNSTTVAAAEAQGITAGKQWFAAQAGNLASATVPNTGITVNLAAFPRRSPMPVRSRHISARSSGRTGTSRTPPSRNRTISISRS